MFRLVGLLIVCYVLFELAIKFADKEIENEKELKNIKGE